MRIQSKIILAVVALTVLSVGVVAFYASSRGRAALRDKTFDQLTAVRASKARLIEELFESIEGECVVLSEDPTVIDALTRLSAAYEATAPAADVSDDDLRELYELELRAITDRGEQPVPEHFMPRDDVARTIQALYLRDNPHPKGQREELDDARDGSAYSQVHADIHPFFRRVQREFDFYDVFLIDVEGRVLYTVFKEFDLGQDLDRGPLSTSGLADAWRAARRQPDRGRAVFTDIARYRPSGDVPAAFAAAPVFDGNTLVGTFVIQMPARRINSVLTSGGRWADEGLGRTGEVYVVGDDYLMRSDSRFFLEDADAFIAELTAGGTRSDVIDALSNDDTTALNLGDRTPTVQAALDGQSGTVVGEDYRGHEVLASYAPLDIAGLHYAIVAHIDADEAFGPIDELNRNIAVVALAILLGAMLFGLLLGYLISRPLAKLRAAIHALREGRTDVEVPTVGGGEVAGLGRAYVSLRDTLTRQREELDVARRRRETMLATLMPTAFARKLEADDGPAVDELPQVCVLHADIAGIDEALQRLPAEDAADALGELFEAFDSAARQQGAETLRVAGSGYIAVAGLGEKALDLTRRVVLLTREMRQSCVQFNRRRGVNLSLSAGIHVGPAFATLTGKRRVLFDLYGEAPSTARALAAACPPGAVAVSDEVRDTLDDDVETEPLHVDGLPDAHVLLDLTGVSRSPSDSAAGIPAITLDTADLGPSGEDA